jgi:cytochrome c2
MNRTGHFGSILLAAQATSITFCIALCACNRASNPSDAAQESDPRQGKIEIERAACGSCHTIPGIPGADAQVGPPLDRFGERKFVAGLLPNTPDNLALWIARPQQIAPGNVMPGMSLNRRQARDIAAYLEQLH